MNCRGPADQCDSRAESLFSSVMRVPSSVAITVKRLRLRRGANGHTILTNDGSTCARNDQQNSYTEASLEPGFGTLGPSWNGLFGRVIVLMTGELDSATFW